MAFCIQCGAKLEDGQKFCSECGAPQMTQSAAPIQAPPAPQEEKTTFIPLTNEEPMERTTYLPKQDYAAPAAQNPYEPPKPAYEAPKPAYEAPKPAYEAPKPAYQAPQADSWQMQPGFTMGAGKEKKPKKKGGIIALILVLVLLVGGAAAFFLLGGMDLFSGGSNKDVDEDILGTYNAVSCIYKKKEQGVDGEWLELKANGKGKLELEGEEYSFKWELDDEDLTIIQKGDEYTGTLEDDVIVLDINGMEYTFVLEGSDAEDDWEDRAGDTPAAPAATEAPAPTDAPVADAPVAPAPAETMAPVAPEYDEEDPNDLAYWEGDWYGWWIINTVYEGDTDQEGMWWDCCANLVIDDDGFAVMTIWDEDGSRFDELGEVYFQVDIVDDGVAEFWSVGGSFGGMDVGEGEWYCRTDDDTEYDRLFWITATYDNGDGLCFDFTFYMRPWGMLWDDIEEGDPLLLPGYYDWYVSKVEAGYDEAPDTIG